MSKENGTLKRFFKRIFKRKLLQLNRHPGLRSPDRSVYFTVEMARPLFVALITAGMGRLKVSLGAPLDDGRENWVCPADGVTDFLRSLFAQRDLNFKSDYLTCMLITNNTGKNASHRGRPCIRMCT